MNKVTVIACVSFAFAMAVETLVWVAFLHRLRTRHPQQWLHASQPVLWQHRTLLSARSTMLYLHNQEYLDSMDRDGIRYCGHHRDLMLLAYWITAITGIAALLVLALHGW